MACYHPIPARTEESGPWTLHPQLGTQNAQLPCGKCLGCRTSKQLDWTHRAVHEASLWRHNRFLTLTYDDAHLPRELEPHDLTNFFKRLRKKCSNDDCILSDRHASIRYLACGEYGEHTERPHYHACLFNVAFCDEQLYSQELSESRTLSNIWGRGAAKLAAFTPATAGYVAGYLTKRGKQTYADEWGEERHPPFQRASLRPAIGLAWLQQHSADLQHGYLVANAKRNKIPRYYIKKLLEDNQTRRNTQDQQEKPRTYTDQQDPQRIADTEKIHEQHINKKHRGKI